MKMRNWKILIKYLFIALLAMGITNCVFNVRKNVEPKSLVSALRKDSLFTKFRGYSVTPRDESGGIYLINRAKDPPSQWHWVKYHPQKTKYTTYYSSYVNEDSIIVNFTTQDSLEILNKAHELIGILKDLHMRWAGWGSWTFNCYFNDSTRMTYVKNKNELDSDFYRFHKNLNWIDSNFVTYY